MVEKIPTNIADLASLKIVLAEEVNKIMTLNTFSSEVLHNLFENYKNMDDFSQMKLVSLFEDVSKNSKDFVFKFAETAVKNNLFEKLIANNSEKIDHEDGFTREALPNPQMKAVMALAQKVVNSRVD